MLIVQNYKNYIQALKTEKRETIEKFIHLKCDDDAMFAKIELNIVEIFEKMFHISEKKALMDQAAPIESLKNTYIEFFENIPSSWYVQLEKSKQFGNTEETHKETLKINQANAMKSAFLNMLQEVTDEYKQ